MEKQPNRILLRPIAPPAAPGVTPPSDQELMQQFVGEHDKDAFEALVRRHGPMVLGLCRRILREEHDAEDAFQATFLVLARKAASLRRQEAVGNWLHGVCTRLSLRARADAARRRDREQQAPTPRGTDPLAELTVREAQQIVDEELNRLPEKYGTALVLCCFEGLARDEAAQRLGCSEAAVKSRLERARELLRQRLRRRGLSLPAALLASLLGASAGKAAMTSHLVEATVSAGTAFASGSLAGSIAGSRAVALAAKMLPSAACKVLVVVVCLLLAAVGIGVRLSSAPDRSPTSEEQSAQVGSQKEGQAPAPAPPAPPKTQEPRPDEPHDSGVNGDGFITRWLMLAALPLEENQSGADAIGKEQIKDEAKLAPRAGDKHRVGDAELVWQEYKARDYFFDFNDFLGNKAENCVGYAV